MAEETSVADPAAGIETVNPVVPESSQSEQSPAESQSAATSQVETSDNQPQIKEAPKPDYQGLYKADRKRIRRLEDAYNRLLNERKQPSSTQDASKNEPLDHSLINQDVDKYLSQREQRTLQPYEQRILALERALEDKAVQERDQKSLGALEKLYPKSSPESNETLAERVQRDPDYSDRLKEFFNTPLMKAMSAADPDEAVEYAIHKLGIKPQPNPTVIKKSAMGGVGTGNPGTGKPGLSVNDLRSENKKLSDQLNLNPELRKDEKFMKRKAEVMQNLERLMTRKTG